VYAAIVELDALTDPDGSRSDYDDLFPVGNDYIVMIFVCGVIIWCYSFKFSCACVDDLVYGLDRVFFPEFEYRVQRHIYQVCYV